MDLADFSHITEEHNRQDAINKVAVSDKRELLPVEYCQNCYDEVTSDKLFCNGDCASAYEVKKLFRFKR